MKVTFAQLAILAGSAIAAPAPVASPFFEVRRAMNAAGITDADILNYALTLEHLEATFYKEALDMYSQADFDAAGYVPRTRFNVEEIAFDEATHVSFLTSALSAAGATPVAACTYDFGLTGVESFLATASILEGVGVSAYLGAAAAIANPAYLTAAGSILTVEARHNAYIRDNVDPKHPQSPFPYPFDIPLSLNEVYTLAAPFIKSCPDSNPALPVKAFPSLTAGIAAPVPNRAGYVQPFRTSDVDLSTKGKLYCGWPAVAGPYFTPATIDLDGTRANCTIPAGVPGQTYVVLTTSNKEITDSNTVAGPAVFRVESPYVYPGFPM